MVILVPIWMSPRRGESGTTLGLNLTWLLWSSTGPHRELVTCYPPAPHLDLVTLVLPGHHRDMVTVFPTGTHLILVTLVLTLASSVQVILSPPGLHLYMVTLILSIA